MAKKKKEKVKRKVSIIEPLALSQLFSGVVFLSRPLGPVKYILSHFIDKRPRPKEAELSFKPSFSNLKACSLQE